MDWCYRRSRTPSASFHAITAIRGSKLMADNKPSECTRMAEAIAFVSATLGEPFNAAQGAARYWTSVGERSKEGRPNPWVSKTRVVVK